MFRSRFLRIWMLIGLALLHGRTVAHGQTARYRITLDATWSAETFPEATFPVNPHFSGLIGASHDESYSLWRPGELASEGLVVVAETGSKSTLRPELDTAQAAGSVKTRIDAGGISHSPGSVSDEIDVFASHPFVSIVSMIAPSPDWIVGFHDVRLFDEGTWAGKLVLDAHGYDAGSDSGTTFVAFNEATTPRQPITRLATGPFANDAPFGTLTILRLLDGDLTNDGVLGADDIDALSAALRTGETNAHFDLNNDSQVNDNDRVHLINELNQTYLGDSNLDGTFDSGDLVTVFMSGEYEDGDALNSTWATGDWDGNGDFETSDIVAAFDAGGYDVGPRTAIASVPEPRGTAGLILLLPLLLAWRRHEVA